MTVAAFAGFQTLLILNWEIPEFCKTSYSFRGISVKIHKIWGNSWISSEAHRAFSAGFSQISSQNPKTFSNV